MSGCCQDQVKDPLEKHPDLAIIAEIIHRAELQPKSSVTVWTNQSVSLHLPQKPEALCRWRKNWRVFLDGLVKHRGISTGICHRNTETQYRGNGLILQWWRSCPHHASQVGSQIVLWPYFRLNFFTKQEAPRPVYWPRCNHHTVIRFSGTASSLSGYTTPVIQSQPVHVASQALNPKSHREGGFRLWMVLFC